MIIRSTGAANPWVGENAPDDTMKSKTIAVVFGTLGGMSDVGKFALQRARSLGLDVRAVTLYDGRTQQAGGFEVANVKDEQLRAQLSEALLATPVTQLNIASEEAQGVIQEALSGADAVIASFGSRQSELPCYLGLGIRKVVAAMKAESVERLVCLSSFGIGDDFMPISPIKLLWGTMLRVGMRRTKADLEEMEAAVMASSLDYVLVRPMAILPEEPVTGSYDAVSDRGQGRLRLSVAKSDVAKCLVDEAVEPTFHRAAITVGKRP